MRKHVERFKPRDPLTLQGFDVDAFVVELDGDDISFRLELGRGLDIFWALPAAPNDRLRLLHVDSAVSYIDEVTLHEDPWRVDVPQLHFVGNRAPIVSVTFDALASPPGYSCEIVLIDRRVHRSWRG